MADPWDFNTSSPDFMPERAAGYNNVKTLLQLTTEYNPQLASFSNNAGASQQTQLCNIAQASLFRGGSLTIIGAATCANDKIIVTLDSEEIFNDSLQNMLNTWQVFDGERAIYLRCMDSTNFIYTVAFRAGLDFNSTFVVKYEETYGRNPSLNFAVLYSPIPT